MAPISPLIENEGNVNVNIKTIRQSAFTLVELLVVIAIIGVLVALLLPAVQAAREAARRTQCTNQLKQIGLTIQNYHSTFNRIPNSHDFDNGENSSSRGWICMILPYVEQQTRYDLMQPYFKGLFGSGTGINHPDLANVVNQPVPGFRCPSDADASQPVSTEQWQWIGQEIALTNYKGVMGNHVIDPGSGDVGVGAADCLETPDCNGLFWRYSYLKTIRFKDVTDGLSNTFLVGEDLPRYNFHSALYHGNGTYSNTHLPLNTSPEPPTPDDWSTALTFRSDHPGGANFALVDGAVAFVADGIDYDTYRFLSTRNGGELVTGF